MISIKLTGGLGNQMFQYSLGRKLSIENEAELILDTSFYRKNKLKIIFKNITKIIFGIFIKNNVKNIFKKIKQNKRQYDLKYFELDYKVKKSNKINLPVVDERKEFCFDENILKFGDNFAYSGYFNTEKYFDNIQDIIRDDFKLKKFYDEILPIPLREKIRQTTSVSIHVRRGDYVNVKNINKYHGVCEEEYYMRAVNLMRSKLSNLSFFVFSDDIDWCKKNLKFMEETTFVSGLKNYEDLILMSECKHNIIANSTFSWWGAWLNKNVNKIIIAPKNWLASTNIETSDLLLKTWIKI